MLTTFVCDGVWCAGEPIDERGPIATTKHWPIHRESPPYVDMRTGQDILVTGIKVIDLLAPYAKGTPTTTSSICIRLRTHIGKTQQRLMLVSAAVCGGG